MPRGLIDGLFSYNKLTLQKQCKSTAFSLRLQSPKIANSTPDVIPIFRYSEEKHYLCNYYKSRYQQKQ